MKVVLSYLIVFIFPFLNIGSVTATEGVVGATCESDPKVYAKIEGEIKEIYCATVEPIFYPGLTMVLAKEATVKECKKRNALDNSGNYPDASSTCTSRCDEDTYCIYGDNR